MTSVELRYYLKLAKLLRISKSEVADNIVNLKGTTLFDNKLLSSKRFHNKLDTVKYVQNFVDSFDKIWLFVYDAKDFGPIEIEPTKIKNHILDLIDNSDEIFVVTSPLKREKMIVDIDHNDGILFDVTCEVYGGSVSDG